MPVEFLPASAPWPIEMPAEPDRGRVLEARKDGAVKARYTWDDHRRMWLRQSRPGESPWHWYWFSIVANAMQWDLELFSLPPETGLPPCPHGNALASECADGCRP